MLREREAHRPETSEEKKMQSKRMALRSSPSAHSLQSGWKQAPTCLDAV